MKVLRLRRGEQGFGIPRSRDLALDGGRLRQTRSLGDKGGLICFECGQPIVRCRQLLGSGKAFAPHLGGNFIQPPLQSPR